jgi:hypothetical protein
VGELKVPELALANPRPADRQQHPAHGRTGALHQQAEAAAWFAPANITAADGVYSDSPTGGHSGLTTDSLDATNFGFTIP